MNKYSEIWNILDMHFSEYAEEMAGPVECDLIDEAENTLGVRFSQAYRKFLLIYGGAAVGSKLVFGLRKQADMGVSLYDVLTVTKFYRDQNWPETDKW